MSHDWWAVLYPVIFDRREKVHEALLTAPRDWWYIGELQGAAGVHLSKVYVSVRRMVRDGLVEARLFERPGSFRKSRKYRLTPSGTVQKTATLSPWYPSIHN